MSLNRRSSMSGDRGDRKDSSGKGGIFNSPFFSRKKKDRDKDKDKDADHQHQHHTPQQRVVGGEPASAPSSPRSSKRGSNAGHRRTSSSVLRGLLGHGGEGESSSPSRLERRRSSRPSSPKTSPRSSLRRRRSSSLSPKTSPKTSLRRRSSGAAESPALGLRPMGVGVEADEAVALLEQVRELANKDAALTSVRELISSSMPMMLTSVEAIVEDEAESARLLRYAGDTPFYAEVSFLMLVEQYRAGDSTVRASLMEHIVSTYVRDDGKWHLSSVDGALRHGVLVNYDNGGRAVGLADSPSSAFLFDPLLPPVRAHLDVELVPVYARSKRNQESNKAYARRYDQLGKLQAEIVRLKAQLQEEQEQNEAWQASYMTERRQREKAQKVFQKLLKEYNDDQATIRKLKKELKAAKNKRTLKNTRRKTPTRDSDTRGRPPPPSIVAPAPAAAIRTVDDFEIQGRLGRGAFGSVYLARETSTQLLCAIKKMSKNLIIDRNQVHTIYTEAQVMKEATAEHSPWLVPLHYAFSDAHYLYLAMGLSLGGDLRSLLENVDLEEEQVRFFSAEMIAAVDALHKRGFVHRDLKPDNFLLHSSGHLKLADFGLSKAGYEKEAPARRISSNTMEAKAVRVYFKDRSYRMYIATKTTTVTDLLMEIKAKSNKVHARDNIQLSQISVSQSASGKQVIKELNLADDELILDVCARWEVDALKNPSIKFKLQVKRGEKRTKNRLTKEHSSRNMTTRDPYYQPPAPMKREKLYSIVGTPGYMAKEIIEGGGYEAIVDWWSIGCIIYEMLVGMPPFTGDTPEELFSAVLNSDETLQFPPDSCSEEAQHLVRSFLTHPKERLGAKGVQEIRAHPFFASVSWDDLATQDPPFVPELEGELDMSYFASADPNDRPRLDAMESKEKRLIYDPWAQDWDWSAG